jgi:hypothetical protein
MFFQLALSFFGLVCWAAFAPASAQLNVNTYHYDNPRSGWNQTETVLTASNVNSSSFGVVATVSLDDQVDAQPLIVTNTVYVATENNTIYAIDAASGAVIRSVNLGPPVPISALPGGCADNGHNVGITSTPVIDVAAQVMYVITYTYENSAAVYKIHKISMPSLSEITNRVISASALLSDGQSVFNFKAAYQRQRPALLEANGVVYAAFGSFCDFGANFSRGWVLGWSAGTLAPVVNDLTDTQTALQTPHPPSPQGNFYNYYLSSIWMSGYGIASDASGDLFFATSNSDTVRTNNIQESAVRLSANLTTVRDYFTPYLFSQYDQNDEDFGSGGLMLVPPQAGIPSRAVLAGKSGFLYIMSRQLGQMGGYVPGGPDNPQSVSIGGGCWCGPSYFIGSDGVGRIVTSGGNFVQTWKNTASFPTTYEAQYSLPVNVQDPGFFTSVSSNGTQAGSAIIWAVGRPTSASTPDLTLYAFNGTAIDGSLPLLYSAVAGTWPNLNSNANTVPVVANGRVYVASYQTLTIFGLLPPSAFAAVKQAAPLKVTANPLYAGPQGQRIFGTITSVSGDHIVVQLRSGMSVSVDLANALGRYESVIPVAGENVEVLGASLSDGSFVASSMMRAKAPATWGPDTR